MKFNPTIPIYIQIMDNIKEDIVTGMLECGERIDSVRALSEKYGVNLNTMQRACAELERQNVLVTQRGVGSFVTEDGAMIESLKNEMSAKMVEEFISGMRRIGFDREDIINIIGDTYQ